LRARLEVGRQANDFNQYYALAGFYAAEVGLPGAGDPFRNEFRTGLEAAAKGFKTSEKMKRIFTLSLLAQCFPDEPVGKQARVNAFAAAFEAVAARPAEPLSAGILPSPVPGHSVQLMSNNTDHHLLAFYRGAESIAVHCSPRRRGTVVLPDGEYEIVVLSPASNIVPFRGKGTFQRTVRISDYTIQTSGGRSGESRPNPGAVASGDYKLLYAPAALGAVTVEPRSGVPLFAR
jgi:hypothetical protein